MPDKSKDLSGSTKMNEINNILRCYFNVKVTKTKISSNLSEKKVHGIKQILVDPCWELKVKMARPISIVSLKVNALLRVKCNFKKVYGMFCMNIYMFMVLFRSSPVLTHLILTNHPPYKKLFFSPFFKWGN